MSSSSSSSKMAFALRRQVLCLFSICLLYIVLEMFRTTWTLCHRINNSSSLATNQPTSIMTSTLYNSAMERYILQNSSCVSCKIYTPIDLTRQLAQEEQQKSEEEGLSIIDLIDSMGGGGNNDDVLLREQVISLRQQEIEQQQAIPWSLSTPMTTVDSASSSKAITTSGGGGGGNSNNKNDFPNHNHKHNSLFGLYTRQGLGESHIHNQDHAVLVDPLPLTTTGDTVDNKTTATSSSCFLMGVFDGHGDQGHVVSDFVASHLPKLFQSLFMQQQQQQQQQHDARNDHNDKHSKQKQPHMRQQHNPRVAGEFKAPENNNYYNKDHRVDPVIPMLIQTFRRIHYLGPQMMDSGSTGSVVLRIQNRLYLANAGDSRSFVTYIAATIPPNNNPVSSTTSLITTNQNSSTLSDGAYKSTIVQMTQPHKPNDPLERQRIEKSGCMVLDPEEDDPTARVVNTNSLIQEDGNEEGSAFISPYALAMSRSFGDYDLESCGVIPEPTIQVVDLQQQQQQRQQQENSNCNNGKFLIVSATDGLLDKVSMEEIIQKLAPVVIGGHNDGYNNDDNDENNNIDSNDETHNALGIACEELIRIASDRWKSNSIEFLPYRDDITIVVRIVALPT